MSPGTLNAASMTELEQLMGQAVFKTATSYSTTAITGLGGLTPSSLVFDEATAYLTQPAVKKAASPVNPKAVLAQINGLLEAIRHV